jgi:Alpha-L-arabinofuranosidase B, catalytic
MRRLIAVLLAAALAAGTLGGEARADFRRLCVTGVLCGAPNPPGILDQVPGAAAAYGLRKLSRAYAGFAVNLRRASDNAQTNVGFDRLGNLNVGAVSSFCAATTCFVTKEYDQSGNGNDASQATAANQPTLTLAVSPTGKPMLVFAGTHSLTTPSVAQAANWTMVGVGTRTGSLTSLSTIFGNASAAAIFLGWAGSANNATSANTAGTITAAAADNTIHSLISAQNGTQGSLQVDGSLTTGAFTAQSATSAPFGIGQQPSFGHPLTGDLGEVIFFNLPLSTGQQTSVYASQKVYWGTP